MPPPETCQSLNNFLSPKFCKIGKWTLFLLPQLLHITKGVSVKTFWKLNFTFTFFLFQVLAFQTSHPGSEISWNTLEKKRGILSIKDDNDPKASKPGGRVGVGLGVERLHSVWSSLLTKNQMRNISS